MTFKWKTPFRTKLAEDTYQSKYAHEGTETWDKFAKQIVEDVCVGILSTDECTELVNIISTMKFVPAGRYIAYAGMKKKFWNNCAALSVEDSRESWAELAYKATSCLMTGAGIGVAYDKLREKGARLRSTGGTASGPLSLMRIINEIGREVMQGGSRRSAILASLNWTHPDIHDFIQAKNWSKKVRRLKAEDFNFPAPLDMTNVTVSWTTDFIQQYTEDNLPAVWYESVRRMCKTGEPGHGYNFGDNEEWALSNACGEFKSKEDSNFCNLGSINLSAISSIRELEKVVYLASRFLVCGTLRAELPYDKCYTVREKYRQIGLGITGLHEWLLQRGYNYNPVPELEEWLLCYAETSEIGANQLCDSLGITRPAKYRAIAPAGTLSILCSTTSGIEPLFAVAYKRRYLTEGTQWNFQYVIDPIAERYIQDGLDHNDIDTAYSLSSSLFGIERRLHMQAVVQKYVDMGISSTINLPSWGSDSNNEGTYKKIAKLMFKYAPSLRGITCFPDGARDGQPLSIVDYAFAKKQLGVVFVENEETCVGGICSL